LENEIIKKNHKNRGHKPILLLSVVAFYIYSTTPKLPDETESIIKAVMKDPLAEIIKGKTGYAKSQGLDIWYESISPKDTPKGTILLIMGISNDALGWPPKFIQAFVDSGYQVIRYDHRGTGMSDWVKNWDSKNPYSLTDMANDGVAVLNSLGVPKAHILGVSMGGMIAQELAIKNPNRVKSLISIMSSGYIVDTTLPPISSNIALELIKISLKYGIIGGEENMIKLHAASRLILRNNASNDFNVKDLARQVLYNMRQRKGYNSNVSAQHQAAVQSSGSRYDKLKMLEIPTLIVHGNSDPFIPIEHGKKCVAIIPHADSLWVENMGHDIPDNCIKLISKKVIATFNKAMQ
jgi:pimeloyl-ACP methyl ester carboxylesterase